MTLPWDTFEQPPLPKPGESIVVIGAGLAGCWLARLLAEKGVPVRLMDSRTQVGCGASGNTAGIVKPFVTRQPSFAMQFHVAAHACLLRNLEQLGLKKASHFKSCDVLQLTQHQYPVSTHYKTLDAVKTQSKAGVTTNSQSIQFSQGGWLSPTSLCRQLIKHPLVSLELDHSIVDIYKINATDKQAQWMLSCCNGTTIRSTQVVVANGNQISQFKQTANLPIVPARGQVSRFRLKPKSPRLQTIVSGKHYAIPDKQTILIGATFDRGNQDEHVCHSDHQSNLRGLISLLPSLQVEPQAVDGFAGVRATTPDRLPLVGPVADHLAVAEAYESLHQGKPISSYPSLPIYRGLFVLGGLGSRGIVTAPLAAQLLVAFLLNESSADENSLSHWAPLCNPVRFQIRALKRGYNPPVPTGKQQP